MFNGQSASPRPCVRANYNGLLADSRVSACARIRINEGRRRNIFLKPSGDGTTRARLRIVRRDRVTCIIYVYIIVIRTHTDEAHVVVEYIIILPRAQSALLEYLYRPENSLFLLSHHCSTRSDIVFKYQAHTAITAPSIYNSIIMNDELLSTDNHLFGLKSYGRTNEKYIIYLITNTYVKYGSAQYLFSLSDPSAS